MTDHREPSTATTAGRLNDAKAAVIGNAWLGPIAVSVRTRCGIAKRS
jgi:hypothetical protein